MCSEEERDFQRRKKIYPEPETEEQENIKKTHPSTKKNLRTTIPTNLKLPPLEEDDFLLDTPYKNSKPYTDFNEQDLEMINKINFPRRKKGRNAVSRVQRESFFYNQRSQVFKAEINEFLPEYQKELDKALQSKYHSFMKAHFPHMYNINNFYTYIFKVGKHRNPIEKLEEEVLIEKNIDSNEIATKEEKGASKCRKVWDCEKIQQSESKKIL